MTLIEDSIPGAAQPRPQWRGVVALVSLLVLSVFSNAIYPPLLSIPSIRSTAWPVFAIMIACAVASLVLARRWRRPLTWVIAGVNTALPLSFAGAFFGLLALPHVDPRVGTQFPDFTLRDQNERPVALAEVLSQGPALLVFYRGHW